MAAIGNDPEVPSTTEEVPAAPGWVEAGVDEILGILPARPSLRGLRNSYLDCLAAGAAAGGDLDNAHDRCRRQLLDALRDKEGTPAETLRTLEQKLEALEADVTARIR
jgi:hypothetical protein